MSHLKPEIVEVDRHQFQELTERIRPALAPADAELIEKVFASYEYVTGLIQEKSLSIGRLQKLLFGAQTEKTRQVVADTTPASPGDEGGQSPENAEDAEPGLPATNGKPPPKGHGRHKAEAYRGAKRVNVPHESLCPGDECPECGRGTVYEKLPAVVIRITGQAPLGARRYELQKLRCHLCGKIFTAELPEGVSREKYDARAGAMIGLLKYGSGLPFYRLAGLQRNLEIPLPASTQWDVVSAFAPRLTPVLEELIRQAAQGEVLYNDDTTVKILALMGKRREKNGESSERTGLFTSGIVSTREGRRLALFFSGPRHAGENLAAVLAHRVAELPPPIQMCDALSRNLPAELEVILANCLAHARRKFVDVYDHFPEPCRFVLEAFRVIYHNERITRDEEMNAGERLKYHQAHSQPAMTELQQWLGRQFDDKQVEPNSSLGAAIKYVQKHWEKLTRFLHVAGAPLDNNLCERALKKVILHRKNALFFQTQNGADVGDLYLSLIHTCELNQVNPFAYLTEVLNHPEEVAACPARFLPWNYREQLVDALSR